MDRMDQFIPGSYSDTDLTLIPEEELEIQLSNLKWLWSMFNLIRASFAPGEKDAKINEWKRYVEGQIARLQFRLNADQRGIPRNQACRLAVAE